MLSNISEFEVLIERYDHDPGICSKLLRKHSQNDPKSFLDYAQEALLERPVSRALKFIAGLAIATGLIEALLRLYPRSREDALAIAQKTIACDPRFDYTLLEVLQRPIPAQLGETAFHVGLDILDAISPGDRMVPGVLRSLKHQNPRVRSKAALFVGSRTQNLAWATSGTQDYDPRVRANILESLHGVNSDSVNQMFWNNVADENNRVAGNAVLGLYLLGQTAAIPLIYEMRKHPEARFRNTAAWLMGRTGDPRFALAFSELMKDPDEFVRTQAFKGLGAVRKALRVHANRPPLRTAIVKAETGESPSLIATVRDLAGQPVHGISPTGFILKTGTPAKPVRSFDVKEYACRSPLTIAFVMCLPDDNEADAEARFTEAIQACNGLRRSKDRWGILKIGSKIPSQNEVPGYRRNWAVLNVEPGPGASSNVLRQDRIAFDYSSHQTGIDSMLRESPIALDESSFDEARSLLSFMLRVEIGWNNPHIIFLGASARTHLISALTQKGQVTATVHVLAQSSTWDSEEAREIVKTTGGIYRSAPDKDALPEICAEAYSSLLHHYRIDWREDVENLGLDVYSERGKSSATYDPGLSRSAADRLAG
jgi:hypothetical protein